MYNNEDEDIFMNLKKHILFDEFKTIVEMIEAKKMLTFRDHFSFGELKKKPANYKGSKKLTE